MFVRGSENLSVELLFDDPTITHTSIDNDLRLHNLIVQNIEGVLTPPVLTNSTVAMPETSAGLLLAGGLFGLALLRFRTGRLRPANPTPVVDTSVI